jgi:hypothetical protein
MLTAVRADTVVDLSAMDHGYIDAVAATYRLWCANERSTLALEPLLLAPHRTWQRLVWSVETRANSAARIVAESSVQLSSPVVGDNQRRGAGRAIALLMRALEGRARGESLGRTVPAAHVRPRRSFVDSLHAASRSVIQVTAGRVGRRWARYDVWFLAFRELHTDETQSRAPRGYQPWGTTNQRFAADPCLFVRDGVTYLFFEDSAFKPQHGRIAWSRVNDDGTLTPPQIALDRPYHLSYPFVFEHDGDVFMIPESAANRTVDLYRAARFPHEWVFDQTLLHDIDAVDATIHYDGRWWMFVNIGEYGSSTVDELFLFSADTLRGPWISHPMNPVNCDAASARPAGRLFREGDDLVRPAQNCSVIYGGAITLNTVELLSETDYREANRGTIGPERLPGVEGVHTLSRTDRFEVIDGKWSRKPRWWRGYPR